jgi:hypothetical protein
MVSEGLPREMKMAKVVNIHKPGKTDWSSPRSYRAISLLSTIGEMAEKAVADYVSLMGEQKGWWHKGQFRSRARRSTIDTLAFLKQQVTSNRRIGRYTALLMTDVAAAFPSTTKVRVVFMLIRKGVHPTVIKWVNSWFMDRSIETWIDNKPVSKREVKCGVPQGSPFSPVLFALTLAETLDKLPDGISYVDDCSWTFSFAGQADFQQEATPRLDNIRDTLLRAGFQMDKDKTEVAWFFASERPRGPSIAKAKKWRLDWEEITRKFDIKAKPVRWLSFFLDYRMNWGAHVKHRLHDRPFLRRPSPFLPPLFTLHSLSLHSTSHHSPSLHSPALHSTSLHSRTSATPLSSMVLARHNTDNDDSHHSELASWTFLCFA